MVREEFNEVIKSFNITNSLSYTFDKGKMEKVYYWNELVIWYGNGYAVVKGKIPLVLATSVWEKYPNGLYQIRVNGGAYDDKPKEFAVDEQYEREVNDLCEKYAKTDAKKYIEECKNALEKMKKRSNSNKYINCYHIDTKDGFNIFLEEYCEYLISKKEEEKEKIINEVVKTLIKKL